MHSAVYDSNFYERQMYRSRRSAEEVVPIILSLVQPRTVVDVGCGMGTWLSVFQEHGIKDIAGIDGAYVDPQRMMISPERFFPSDLASEISHHGRYDLVVSLEVAEHLPASRAAGFIQELVGLGPLVLFSAAIPGQGGTHHINEQWPDYWRDLFAQHDYVAVDCLRSRLWSNRDVQVCYRQNMLFYAARKHLAEVPELAREQSRNDMSQFSIVHPQLFAECLARPPSLKRLLRAFPGAVSATIKRRLS